MNTKLEFIDIQWTVVSLLPSPALFAAVRKHAKANDWLIQSWSVTSKSGDEVSQTSRWPTTTLGSMTIEVGGSAGSRNLFWSSVATQYGTIVTGGLYIGQYALNLRCFNAYARAMDTLRALFWTEKTLCIVLTLEDDSDVDIGPGIIGLYRRDIWQAMELKSEELSGLEVKFDSLGRVEVMPVDLKETAYLSLCDMSERSRSSVYTVQHRLEEYLQTLQY